MLDGFFDDTITHRDYNTKVYCKDKGIEDYYEPLN